MKLDIATQKLGGNQPVLYWASLIRLLCNAIATRVLKNRKPHCCIAILVARRNQPDRRRRAGRLNSPDY
ncbi:hypothetical protein CWB41_10055 [Methylovirgula ligni]|nr:hypothetical protein CWB41_10055 [Methylovirgula ligni]